MKYWSYKRIEDLTNQRLSEYEMKYGAISAPPIPLDKIIENLYDIRLSWEYICEKDGEQILGGLRPQKKQIVINEKHLDLFEQKPGLENFTKGHELGHWDIFVKKDLVGYPELGFNSGGSFLMRAGRDGQEDIRVLMTNIYKSEEAQKKFIELERGKDDPLTRRLVDKYASSLCMPATLLRKVCADYDLLKWPNLYDIQRIFNVTISALIIRLEQMNMIYVHGKQIYRSKEEFSGQLTLLKI